MIAPLSSRLQSDDIRESRSSSSTLSYVIAQNSNTELRRGAWELGRLLSGCSTVLAVTIVGMKLERLLDGRSREELVAAVRAGGRPKWLMFWGHRPLKNGVVDASCLSQWWPAPFVVGKTTYGSAEHWMMAGKPQIFGDEQTREHILAGRTIVSQMSVSEMRFRRPHLTTSLDRHGYREFGSAR